MQTEKVIEYIVDWLKDYAEKAKMDGFVIGISGGIDSAVTSALCAKTGFTTLCVEMPIHQAANQVSRGREHIQFLKNQFPNVQNEEVDLTSVFEQFKREFPTPHDNTNLELSLANTRARLRMTTLYHFAGLYKYLVAGTGNKVEDFGVGFFTKYGDGGVDLSPIADLMKSEMYSLARVLNIPKSIIDAAPTDGLFGDSRTDEDQIGASYDELEWAMQVIEKGEESNKMTERQKEVLKIYKNRHRANLHKMVAIPVCTIPNNLRQ